MRRVSSLFRSAALTTLTALVSATAAAQDAAVRYPETGLPILDCDPAAPAPADSCLLRLPPGFSYSETDTSGLEGVEGSFRMTREGSPNFPPDLQMSTTLLLVDLSPGPNAGRRATFDAEKDLLAAFVSALPSDEEVAVYGFNESLQRLSGFTDDRTALLRTIEDLELQGTNTRIATFVSDAITILAEREDVVLKNILLVSDGQEEGGRPMAEVQRQAVEAGVAVSALGTFWRPVGSAETGRGMDFLEDLTEGAGGGVRQVILGRPDDARQAVLQFAAAYGTALRESALILADGTPQASEISMLLSEPALGNPDDTTSRRISVTFQPRSTQEEAEASEEPAPVPAPTIFGLPSLWVYVGAAIAAILALLGVVAMARQGRSADEMLDDDPGIDEAVEPAIAAPPASPQPPARAFLLFQQDGRRAAVRGSRVNIGRSSSNEIVVDDESVSRLHAQIHLNRDGGFSVTDMDSLNGTEVAGQAVKGTHPVRLGETIRFGTVEVKLTHA